MPPDARLATLRRLTGRRSRVNHDWKQAIRDAHSAGVSLRQIGAAAGVSHVRVLQIVRAHSANRRTASCLLPYAAPRRSDDG